MADPEVLSRLDRIAQLLEKQLERPARTSRPKVAKTVNSPRVGQGLGQVSQAVPTVERVEKPVPKPPRELALDWLKVHPEHHDKPGRWLEENARPEGVVVSYKTWNRAKKESV